MTADVELLSGRLAGLPPLFLRAIDPAKSGAVVIEAVVADLFRDRASRPLETPEVARFRFQPKARRHLQLVLLASGLLHDPTFEGTPAESLLALLLERLRPLAELVAVHAFVEDAERREELVRVCLAALGMTPGGETAAVAEDRLATLDSVRRDRLLRETREREEQRKRERKQELEQLRKQEEEERRKAARTTYED